MVHRIIALALAIACAAALVAGLAASPAPPHPAFRARPPRPLVIAHQGGDGLRPSNTLEAFRNATALGADVLDLDVHLSRDGHIVVIHDQTVDRTTDGAGTVRNLSLAELKRLDAGFHWPYQGSDRPFRAQGISIPTLEEVFTAFPGMLYNIEIKQADPEVIATALCTTLRAHRLQSRTLVSAFRDEPIAAFRRACPEVGTAATQNEVVPFFVLASLGAAGLYGATAQSLQVPETYGVLRLLWPGFVERAHQRGMTVYPWTINDASDMARILAMGVDGINTDYPDRLLQVLGRAR